MFLTLLRFNTLTFQFATVAESARTLQTSLGNDLKYCGGGASAFAALLIYTFMSCAHEHSQSDFQTGLHVRARARFLLLPLIKLHTG